MSNAAILVDMCVCIFSMIATKELYDTEECYDLKRYLTNYKKRASIHPTHGLCLLVPPTKI